MKTDTLRQSSGAYHVWRLLLSLLLLAGLFHALNAQALTINVVNPSGAAVTDFRWLVEEDATKESIPGLPAGAGNLSLNFHTSYMPVVASGRVGTVSKGPNPTSLVLDTAKRYYVSVLPDGGGYQMGGAPVAAGQSEVTIVVNKTPIPTAQISVFVFNDNQPINGKPDLPQEVGLAGFSIILKEAGGTYGQSGGQVTQDAFGNPVGTTYQQDVNGNFIFEVDGVTPKVLAVGNGFMASGPDGVVRVKYLAPAKYTVEVVPPAGSDWHQTSTIEGTKGIDAWVKANEPSFFQEFGPPGHHVDFGFVRTLNDTSVLSGGSTITGKVVNQHMSRPPNFAFYNGAPVPNCWVGLNELPVAGSSRGIYSRKCNADSTFSIPNVPAGIYQLVIWDEFLDRIIASTNVTVPAGGGVVDLLDVPVFDWFGHFKARVFFDANKNGFRDSTEVGLSDQALNLRFRDGSIYQATATNAQGEAEFTEIFPFFNWLVAEVDFARFKATGMTAVVDTGGPVAADSGWTMPSRNTLTPQLQYCMQADVDAGVPECPAAGGLRTNPNTGNALSRTDTGPILTQGIATFLGQTNLIEWGKALYSPGENGGVSGMVQYATVRAEEDPRYAAAENWEPGIPRVQINLYKDFNKDNVIDDLDGNGSVTLSDVDNYPFGWSDGSAPKGPEDIDRNGNGAFDKGDAFDVATTDSWDDNVPAGCQGATFVSNGVTTDCYDGLRNFNQLRPAVFDGGYAFGGGAGKPELAAGTYIVEAVTPPGYETVKEEDKNVDFGDSYTPSPLLLPPVCVGDSRVVPAELDLMPGVASAYAGQSRPLCDRKSIDVAQAKNAGVNFFMFTEVPVAGHIVGFILDDTANEFDPNAPTFGEKHAPPHLPVSIRDWTGRELSRVYSDQWGTYNALVPSSYSVNIPFPSGVSPNMVTTCMNHPGPIQDTRVGSPTFGQMIIDPYFDRQYSQFCYTFQYLPGKTTYLDTPVMPVAAFAGAGQFPVDCEVGDSTPMIYSAEGITAAGSSFGGPYVGDQGNAVAAANQHRVRLVSAGMVEVANPAYDGTNARTILRNYGFGATQGSVTLGGVPLPVDPGSWSNDMIVVRVPGSTPLGNGQLQVVSSDGKASISGITLTVGQYGNAVTPPVDSPTRRVVQAGQTIQQVIDSANSGDLILVPPGTYEEMVIMNKKVRLQGWGAPSTIINAAKYPAEKLQAWRNKVNQLLAANSFDLLPGQEAGINAPNNEPGLFNTEEGPGIMVVAKEFGDKAFDNARNARIDGLTITGADHGGGIFANGHANYLEISNNRIVNNYGTYGGGIRIGHPNLINPTVEAINDPQYGGYTNASNDFVRIHHNHIAQNGGGGEAGGGVALCTGSHNYQVSQNYICGNHTLGNGAGIGHLGRSNNGTIANNKLLFNQSFNQGLGVSGGGIYIGGQASLVPTTTPRPSPGTGNVTVSSNLIQGNQAGAGDGGGIRAEFVNGMDVRRAPGNSTTWYRLNVVNNMVVDNIAGMAGGGISLQDTVLANISNNTIANNDSTATAGAAFAPNSPNLSTPQPAGIVSRAHTTLLYNTIGAGTGYKLEFSNPTLFNNIVWHNRSFYWAIDNTTDPATFGLVPNIGAGQPAVYSDLAVLGTSSPAHQLSPRYSLLTDLTGYGGANNITGDPMFVSEYTNGDQGQTIQQPELTTSIATAPAFDEGGNFIDVRFGPHTPTGDYHLSAGSPALATGTMQSGVPTSDYDGEPRPISSPDIGADERN
ncbi:MAG: choice-of-anchor Q domain-containing protein [Rhodoferax sp.]|uniref:choice-of-anchor Q domain-containing protein n=1 Tax=Rhodoferax sp. TaxID=50421 RepID=UPI00271A8F23|nr:choice-of-anchor Q domain-containing protein [Rhodoferax sp.]MDO8448460.1 choice-of-anchor Q domain-containing protein [Rhodoferax sp.]